MHPNQSDEARYIQALGDNARAYPWRYNLRDGRHEARPRSDMETCRGCSIWAAAFLPLPLGGPVQREAVAAALLPLPLGGEGRGEVSHLLSRSYVVARKDAMAESLRPDSRRETIDGAPNAPAISAQSDEMDTACDCSP